MMAVARTLIDVQGTFGTGFERYHPAKFDFLALNKWNARKRLKTGRVIDLGKAPIAYNWTTLRPASRAIRKACLAELRNMGIRLRANQLVIDVDPRNGGTESFAMLCHDLGLDAGEWPHVITGSGGDHFYVRLPDGFAVEESVDGYAGIEFKSVGRQVVASGSRHPNGRLYRWDRSDGQARIEAGLPLAPTVLLNLIRQQDRRNGATGGGQYTVAQLKTALAGLDPIAFRDEKAWRTLMFACHHATSGDGESVFVDWSASDPQFAGDSDRVIKRWRSCGEKTNAITYLTLNMILRAHDAADAQVAPTVPDDEFMLGEDDNTVLEIVGETDADAFEF